jgi:bifunctional non-homologous end joining protein LigD
MRQRLQDLGLESFLKTTGGKGLHVVAPISRKPDWKEVKEFALAVARQMQMDTPDLYTTNSRKAERTNKIFIDYLRNDKTASAIAPYSTRAREGAPIAVPLGWDELGKMQSAHGYTVENIGRRLKGLKKDPWDGVDRLRQNLPSLEDRDEIRVDALGEASYSNSRLRGYRYIERLRPARHRPPP